MGTQPISVKNRIEGIDVLRGLAMIIMALDHTRDFFSNAGFEPNDLVHTTASLFFTRWITDFCAPVFVFLIGTSMAIAASRGKPIKQISTFLLTRGIWMIFVEFTLVHFGWTLSMVPAVVYCQVIWVIGWAMIALAGLVYLPKWVIFSFGMVLVFGHNLLDGTSIAWISMIHEVKTVTIHWPATMELTFLYSPLPWIAIPALGYVFGDLFTLPSKQRTKYFITLGVLCVLGYLALRYSNIYGDPVKWSTQKDALFTVMSFLNCCKYPPSLSYFLMTLGPAFLLLAVFEHWNNRFTSILSMFGKVPFFYYVIHLIVIHCLMVIITEIRFHQGLDSIGNHALSYAPGWLVVHGYDLTIVYLVWALVILMLYPLCKWYAGVKQRHKNNVWLSYL